MASITGFTAVRMALIEAKAIVSGLVVNDRLILKAFDNTEVDAGNVRGPVGATPVLRGVSVTSTAISTGSKTFAISPAMNVAFPVGATVKAQGAAAGNYMVGLVTAATTTSVTINVTEVLGTGTFASWTLTIGSFRGTDGTVTGTAGGALAGTYPNPGLSASTLAMFLPAGFCLPYAGATIPSGWIMADGAYVLRADYPALFTAISTAHNLPGDADALRFRLPDLRERGVIGASAARTLGTSGGSATKQLTAANLPAHAHTMAHEHALAAKDSAIGAQTGTVTSTAAGGTPVVSVAVGASTSANTGNGPGTGAAFNTEDPWEALNYIIKT